MDAKTKRRRAALAKKLAAIRAKMEGPQRELAELVTAPFATSRNAGKIRRLQDELEKLSDQAGEINREIDEIDQAELIAVANARIPPVTARGLELAAIKDRLTEQRNELVNELRNVRGQLDELHEALNPIAICDGGDPLAIIDEMSNLQDREGNLIMALDVISGAQTYNSQQIGFAAMVAAH